MTRRKIYFYDDKERKLYSTPEFNGDKDEFIHFRKAEDSCDKNFDEILKEFIGVKTKEEFETASNKAQSYYHSFLGDEILPINEVKTNESEDEIYMINNKGEIYLYNPSELTREYLQEVANKGIFIYEDFTISIEKDYSKFSNANIYTMKIESIENIATPKIYNLGAIEDKEITNNLEDFIKSNISEYMKKINTMKQNLKNSPIKLELIYSPNSNYLLAFQSEKGNKYVLDGQKDFFELIKIDTSSGEPEYNLNHPVEIKGNVLYPIFDNWLGEAIFESNNIDIERMKMAAQLNSYMLIREDIYSSQTINKNLNDIYEDIYTPENINKYFFEKYKDDEYIKELQEKYEKFLNKQDHILTTNNGIDDNEEEEFE